MLMQQVFQINRVASGYVVSHLTPVPATSSCGTFFSTRCFIFPLSILLVTQTSICTVPVAFACDTKSK